MKRLRILDLACGSGAILIEAFHQLHAVYELSNARLEELRGQRTLFDLDRQILQHNLYGVEHGSSAASQSLTHSFPHPLPELARSKHSDMRIHERIQRVSSVRLEVCRRNSRVPSRRRRNSWLPCHTRSWM